MIHMLSKSGKRAIYANLCTAAYFMYVKYAKNRNIVKETQR